MVGQPAIVGETERFGERISRTNSKDVFDRTGIQDLETGLARQLRQWKAKVFLKLFVVHFPLNQDLLFP